jgi:predicted phage tail component-like protein
MANYNSGILYNAGIKGGGANYNSAAYYIVEVSDAGKAQELLFFIPSNIIKIFETAHIQEFVSNIVNMSVSDSGSGVDSISDLSQFPADAYFVMTCEGDLNPLGVIVLRDSRHELMPQTRDMTEEIPGRHGEIDFGSEFKARAIELHVATPDGLTTLQKEQLKRTIAKYLNPVSGTKKLVFLDDIDVQYEVKYAGKIDLTKYADWMEFTIPFKMCQPFIESREQHIQTGAGVIVNSGTFETPILIEIPGPANNPTVSIGTSIISYIGTIASGQTLVIDTGAQTAKIGSSNMIANVSGAIDYMLQPGISASVVPSISTTRIKWRDRWL